MNDCLLYPPASRPPDDLVKRLGELPSAAISDSQTRVGGAPGIRGVGRPDWSMVGSAFTVRTRPGDNLVVHKALELADEGDVVVVDAGGATERAIVGGLMCRYAESRGLAGLVLDGAVRDVEDLAAGGLPVFARAINHQGPYKTGPGALRGPIAISGTVVRSGDIVVGDADGVVIVPIEQAAAVADAAEALMSRERSQQEAIDTGQWDRSWIDSTLEVRHVLDTREPSR
jgi:regulator of RNase E activity RraA